MELVICQQTDSTNREAARMVSAGNARHGTAILAWHQTEGKGQYGRQWHAQPGAHMALSVIIKEENMPPSQLPQLSMKTAVALIRVLNAQFPALGPRIKWPNDIFVNRKKAAGILIENSMNSIRVHHSIVGIGMNVNEQEFPEELTSATSLFLETGMRSDVEKLALDTREQLLRVLDEPVHSWKRVYDASLYGRGEYHVFQSESEPFHGLVKGVNEDGKILIEASGDATKAYFAHEIKWLV